MLRSRDDLEMHCRATDMDLPGDECSPGWEAGHTMPSDLRSTHVASGRTASCEGELRDIHAAATKLTAAWPIKETRCLPKA